jgi:integrase/recombinase XerD
MGLAKQAKTLSDKQIKLVLLHLTTTRNSTRNKVIFLLSVKAGFRAKEIASLQWKMLVNSDGQMMNEIHLTNTASKGKSSGRVIAIHKQLKASLEELFEQVSGKKSFQLETAYVITTERSNHTSAQAIVNTFQRWYSDLGFIGASSHSGRRTFITNVAKKISAVGGSMRDVQSLAGHSNLQTTQRYIEVDTMSQRKVIDLI